MNSISNHTEVQGERVKAKAVDSNLSRLYNSPTMNPIYRIAPGAFQGLAKICALALLLPLAACTSMVPSKNLPIITDESAGEKVKVVTVPLPVIASSPNEGITVGALAAFLLHDRKEEVQTLIAPQINHNKNFGTSGSLYAAFNPSLERSIEVNLAQSAKVNYDYEARLRQSALMDGKLEVNAFFGGFADGSSRFYGFNARSPIKQETNYSNEEITYNLSATYHLGRHYYIELGDHFRDVSIRRGAVTKVPYIKDRFNQDTVPGLNGFTTHAPRISFIYSSLNYKTLPTFGGYARVTFEPTARFMGGAENYNHYEAEVKGYIPLDEGKRFISVFRMMYNQTLGNKVPFLEQSILGGENSLRGYGRNRFIDNCYLMINLEERIRLFRWEVFNVTADWELAPFFDVGSVMDRVDKMQWKNYEFNPGLGFRAIVRPNIVGRIDIGIGHDGPAVYVGLGYPF